MAEVNKKETAVLSGTRELDQALSALTGRRRRLRARSLLATGLLAVWLVLLNALVWRFPLVFDLPGADLAPAEQIRQIVTALERPLEIDCVMYPDNPLFPALRTRLSRYRDVAHQLSTEPLRVRFIDPRRDLGLVAGIREDMGGVSEAVLLRYDNESRRLLPEELTERRLNLGHDGLRHKETGYFGDAILAGTIWSMVSALPEKLYVLEGHGERCLDDYDPDAGYSDMARLLRRRGYSWEKLNLAREGRVPGDASAVLWLGPRDGMTGRERDALRSYLDAGGRLLALFDAGVRTGLEPILAEWNVSPLAALVAGRTFTGEELVVVDYPAHPVTDGMGNTLTLFARPGVMAVHSHPGTGRPERSGDSPRTTVLAGIGREDWYRYLDDPARAGDLAGSLRRGPAAVAVALERGGASDVRVPPTRVVVVADSGLGDNRMLAMGAPGNRDFFVNALGWLTDQAVQVSAGESQPTLQAVLSPRAWNWLWYGVGLAWPAFWGGLGVILLGVRRKVAR